MKYYNSEYDINEHLKILIGETQSVLLATVDLTSQDDGLEQQEN